MKKSSFAVLLMGTLSGILFALGMCMALLPEWNAFVPGVILGCAGFILGLITVAVWRKLNKKPAIKISGKNILAVVIGVVGALLLGVGMCSVMVWEKIAIGIVIGVVGIIVLFALIPVIGGFKE